MKKIKGWELDFFSSGEWQVADERLKDLEKNCRPYSDGYCPGREKLFEALRATSYEQVKACIIGQDPFPNPRHATGIAFSIPRDIPEKDYPVTLRTFFKEYVSDLGCSNPSHGDLRKWCGENGVLLWNALPSCGIGRSLSHDWRDQAWDYLTREIVRTLSKKGIVYALLGSVSRRYLGDISPTNNRTIITSHPSPRGNMSSRTPFTGSRLFSTINDHLNDIGSSVVDWSLE